MRLNILLKKIVIILFFFFRCSFAFSYSDTGSITISTDNMTTFKVQPPIGLINSLLIDPITPSTLYAGTGSWYRDEKQTSPAIGLLKSIDSGVTWFSVNKGMPTQNGTLLAIDPNNPQILYSDTFNNAEYPEGWASSSLYKSIDGGNTWNLATLQNKRIAGLHVDPLNSNILYVNTVDEGIIKSMDGGETWIRINNGISDLQVTSLAIDPTNPNILYIGTFQSGVYKSTDAGFTWNERDKGLNKRSVYSFAINPKTPNLIFAGTHQGHGIFKSTDGGRNWHYISFKGMGIVQVYISPSSPSTVFAGAIDVGQYDPILYRSLDNGLTWNNTQMRGVKALVIDPIHPNKVYTGFHSSIDHPSK